MKNEQDDVIELAVASIETKGGPIGLDDQDATFRVKNGLADD